MPLSKERKEDLVAEYIDMLERSKAVIFTEYRGLTNKEMTQIRHKVRESEGRFRVTKLSLLKLAMEQAGYPIPENLSGEPLAIGFCFEEVSGVAKALTDFAEDSELMEIRSGIMNAEFISAGQIEALANLPPLDVIQAQILGLLDAPASNLVGVLQSGVAQVINVLNAYVEQGEGAAAG